MSVIVKQGDTIQNNDPRYPAQIVRVVEITTDGKSTFAVYHTGKRRAKVNVARIVPQGTAHHNKGWTLVNVRA